MSRLRKGKTRKYSLLNSFLSYLSSPSSLISPKSKQPSNSETAKAAIPSKAQRLMGIDSPVYVKSMFDEWEEDDEDKKSSRMGSPLSRRAKGESRVFFRTPTKSQTSLSESSSKLRFPNTSKDPSPLPTPSSRDSIASKWTSLGQRFRTNSNNTIVVSTPTKKKEVTPPITPVFVISRVREIDAMQQAATSSSQRPSTTETPTTSTSLSTDLQRKHSLQEKKSVEKIVTTNKVLEKTIWAEARASSRALVKSTEEPVRENDKVVTPIKQTGLHSISSSVSTLDLGSKDGCTKEFADALQNIKQTPPLQFDPTRRPRAPFPQTEQVGTTTSSSQAGQADGKPSSPPLPPCPTKMRSRGLRPAPSPPCTPQACPTRPRRPTESNIFDKIYQGSVTKPGSPSRKSIVPPRGPPPSSPLPPLPADFPTSPMIQRRRSASLEVRGKTKGLISALGVHIPSPIQEVIPLPEVESVGQKRFSRRISINVQDEVIFCGQEPGMKFAAELTQVHHHAHSAANLATQVELIIGGVSFETQASVLVDETSKTNVGLAHWLKKEMEAKMSKEAKAQSTTTDADNRLSKNTTYSYDTGSFISSIVDSSSSEEESEEESNRPFAYQMSPLPPPQLILAGEEEQQREKVMGTTKKVLTPIQTLHLASPLRRRAHARTPTSVSSDYGSDNGEENDGSERRNSATPELISSSHAFIFTPSPPSNEETKKSSSLPISYAQVKLQRDPQLYPFVLHLLKNGSLPEYFFMKTIPVQVRSRCLQSLSRECQWLGYTNLVEFCNHCDVL